MTRVRAVAIVVTTGLSMRAIPADCETRPVRDAISIGRTGGCIDAPALAAQVVSWLGRDAVDATLSIVVDAPAADRAPGAYRVLQGGRVVAERRFVHLPDDCAAQRAVLGLAIAIGLDAAVLASVVPVVRPSPREAPPVHAARAIAFGAFVEGGALVEAVPGVTWWLYGGFDLGFARRFSLRAGASGAGSVAVPVGAGTADVGRFAGRLDACAGLAPTRHARLDAGVCAGLSAGRLEARGRGFDAPRDATLPWVAAIVRLEGRAAIAPWMSLRLAVDAYAPLVSPRFVVVDGAGATVTSATLPAVALSVQSGLAVDFW